MKSLRASGKNSRPNREGALDNSGAARSRIGDHIERDNSAAVAARIVTAILDHADNLTAFPHIGRPGRIPDTRELVVVDTPFIMPYRVRDAEVENSGRASRHGQWAEKFNLTVRPKPRPYPRDKPDYHVEGRTARTIPAEPSKRLALSLCRQHPPRDRAGSGRTERDAAFYRSG